MKKIVALVLAMVMALSLCTVAFAYEENDLLYDSKTEGEGLVYVYHEASSNYKVGVASANDKTNNVAYLTSHEWMKAADGKVIGYDKTVKDYYYVVEKDGKALYENSTTTASIQRGDKFSFENGQYYAVKGVAVDAEKWSCTTDKHDAGYKYELDDGTVVYAKKSDAASAWRMLVDGKIVRVEIQTGTIKGQHVLVIPKDGAKELDVGVYEGYCAACHKTLKYATTNISGAGALYDLDTAAWLTSNGTVAIPTGYKLLDKPVYVVGDSTKADDTKKDGVDSAKTFDAGVAMYVGMSLLSVAGGAVVIGKKKEF